MTGVTGLTVDGKQLLAVAEELVRVLVELRDNVRRDGGIFESTIESVPFGERNPSGYVYDLRLQAQEAVGRARVNLLIQAGVVQKLLDGIAAVAREYGGADKAAMERFDKLMATLSEVSERPVEQA
ncbi:hypothetical protein [Allorhizocola rhizosphaerae]|uniref:hypothetical protein n=1 Tax=Allorhizocola rhizosphaerae TaxID=1872709 RepID=UPI0013C314CD|nr:hypothetical protein [Allorhizocola rhizosphaerae]